MTMPQKWMIENYEEFGNLIKDWLAGRTPLPQNLDELRQQANAVGARMDIPDNYLKLEVIVRDPTTLTLVLPAPEFIRQTEEKISAGGGYTIPGFYGYLCGVYEGDAASGSGGSGGTLPATAQVPATPTSTTVTIPPITLKMPNVSPTNQMRWMAARVADYTVGQCG